MYFVLNNKMIYIPVNKVPIVTRTTIYILVNFHPFIQMVIESLRFNTESASFLRGKKNGFHQEADNENGDGRAVV